MSFREKSAWISFFVTLVVWGGYVFHVYVWPGDGAGRLAMPLFIGAVIVTVVFQVVLHIGAAVQAPRDAQSPADERDQLISLKATRWSSYAMATGALLAAASLHIGADVVDMANGVIAALALAELVRCASVIAAYRRGA